MAEVKVFYDKEGNTLTVWFDDPQKEHVCEETGEEIILIKDKEGRIIGFEKLNFQQEGELEVVFKTISEAEAA